MLIIKVHYVLDVIVRERTNMISKELLSEVLGKDVEKIAIRENNIIPFIKNTVYKDSPNPIEPINIYYLAHKCKEWCFYSHKIWVSSGITNKEWSAWVSDVDGYECMECGEPLIDRAFFCRYRTRRYIQSSTVCIR